MTLLIEILSKLKKKKKYIYFFLLKFFSKYFEF
jgi:hypothetical protein